MKEDKLILGTLAGVDLILSPEHYEEYKGTLNKQLEEANEENKRLNKELDKTRLSELHKEYIINELEKELKKGVSIGICATNKKSAKSILSGAKYYQLFILEYLKELKENK